MSTLHLINKTGQPFELCQRALINDDAIILIEDATYLLSAAQDALKQLTGKHPVYFLNADSEARGMTAHRSLIKPVNYNRFVELATEFDRTISWF